MDNDNITSEVLPDDLSLKIIALINVVTGILDKVIQGKLVSADEEVEVLKFIVENPNELPQIMLSPQKLMKIIEKNSDFGAKIFLNINFENKEK